MLSFNFTEQGHNHLANNKPCEDYSGSFPFKMESFIEKIPSTFGLLKNLNICVVADGHGGKDYIRSRLGSQFAVECAINSVKEFVKRLNAESIAMTSDSGLLNFKKYEKNVEFLSNDKKFIHLKSLANNILLSWHNKIFENFKNMPFTEEELEGISEKAKNKYLLANKCIENNDKDFDKYISKAYGTTLILFATLDDCCFGFQIGDGRCIAINSDAVCNEVIPWDENCQLNVTTSLCDDDASAKFRFYFSKEKPVAVFVNTDGVDDSYSNIDELNSLYKSIVKIFIEEGADKGLKEIYEYLPVITEKGSGDDVSIAGIIDMDRLLSIKQFFCKNANKDGEVDNFINCDVIKEENAVDKENNKLAREALYNAAVDCIDKNIDKFSKEELIEVKQNISKIRLMGDSVNEQKN